MAPKKRERSEVEHLKATIRAQEKRISELQKEVGQANRKAGRAKKAQRRDADAHEMLKEYILSEEQTTQQVTIGIICPECNSGDFVTANIGVRTLHRCNSCGYRKAVKVNG